MSGAANGRLFTLCVPRAVVLEAMAGLIPPSFTNVVFAQWTADKDSVTIGFTEPESTDEIDPLAEAILN